MPLLAAGIGAGGSVLSGLIGGKSSKSAAKKQGQADQAAAQGVLGATKDAQTGLQGAQKTSADAWALQQNNLSDYLNAGKQGVTSLSSALAPGGSLSTQFAAPTAAEAAATPGEQFMLQQGQQAVDRSAAAGGSLNSGGTLKALTQYGQGLASTAYQQAYNNAMNTFQTNHNNTLSGLLALTGVGQSATGQYDQAAQNFSGTTQANATQQGQFGLQGATTAGNFYANNGQANAMGTLGAGQAGINTLGSLTNIATSLVNGQTQPGGGGASSNPGGLTMDQYPTGTKNYGPTLAQLGIG